MIQVKKLIVFDGVDGVGKSVNLEKLKERLQKQGTPVYHTKALGGDGTDDFQQAIRKVLLHKKFPKDMPMVFEEQLFSVADNEGVKDSIKFLDTNQNGIVLKDRGVASHVVYSMARGMSLPEILDVHGKLFKTEKEIANKYGSLNLLFVPNDVNFTMERIAARAKQTGVDIVERLENTDFQRKVAKLMLEFGSNPLADTFNFKIIVVKKEDTIDDVHHKVVEVLREEGLEI